MENNFVLLKLVSELLIVKHWLLLRKCQITLGTQGLDTIIRHSLSERRRSFAAKYKKGHLGFGFLVGHLDEEKGECCVKGEERLLPKLSTLRENFKVE